ncbi:MAG: transcriptional regulator NrdR [bacterium]|nr:transcriptional regulator NrdR [bacterium]
MKCPFCGHSETAVLESRISEDGNSFRRRRECAKCQKRFTTYERVEGPSLLVIKKDGRRESFDREKLRRGVLKSCEKRPVSLEAVEGIVEEVERELLRKDTIEILSKVIGNAVLRRLKKFDKVAWLRFASVYLEFADLVDFEKAIEKETK